MKWILWRECGNNRVVLIGGAILLLLPYLFVLIVVLLPSTHITGVVDVAEAFAGAALASLVASQITVALLGGNAIAGERANRSAEFIAYLPLSRARLWLGKLTLAVIAVVLVWTIDLLVFYVITNAVPEVRPLVESSKFPLYCVAIAGAVFYGVSWLMSSFQSSPLVAVGGGLIAPVLILMGLGLVALAKGMTDADPNLDPFLITGFAITGTVLAVVCYSIGTAYYLKRVEP